MTRDDCGAAMFSEADIELVKRDLETVAKMFASPFAFHVCESSTVFGPTLLVCASVAGVGSARLALGVDEWARIANNPSPIARGCMWSCALMDQLVAQVYLEWAEGAPPEGPEDDKDDDD